MHTPVEVVSLGDLEQSAKLIVAALKRIDDRSAFVPQ
jgi:putative aminopeptidase FrvX